MQLENLMRAGFTGCLVAPPGCGKTARIISAAKASGRKLFLGIGGRTADLADRVDFGGALVPDARAGVTRTLPLEDLKAIYDCDEPAIWFIDEIGRAPLDVQGGICSILDKLKREKPNFTWWAATNRPGDKAGVSALSSQLESRLGVAFSIPLPGAEDKPDGAVMLGTWKQEVENWCTWAMDSRWDGKDVAAEFIAWHRGFQSIRIGDCGPQLYGWKPHSDPGVRLPDYRSWETSIRLWNAGFRDVSTQASAIGKPQAAAFLSFAALADSLPTAEQIWMDPTGAPVPQEPSSLFLIASVLAGAIEQKYADPFCRYIGRLPRVYAALAARDVYRKLGAKLSAQPAWQKWFVANQSLFSVSN